MLHNLALRHQVPFLQEDGPDVGLVAAVEPVVSEEEEAEEEDIDNRKIIMCVYFELSNVVVFCKCVCILNAAVCTANGLLRLNDRCVDSGVVILWAYSCWPDSVGFAIASLSLTFGVADLCGCLFCGGLRDVGRNTCSGFLPQAWYLGGRQHSGKRDLPPGL
ncbi:hypothetical protein NDU88_000188 [Pleurodeles waltl]|uniref:Uncharacterized protein n=1 Tax=Pleurodeles waltl TaxID=8319 RepID=A0AAV7S6D7_PLEWA|nr:hypothetical protein NDU88_000188 [Pleurodeles waltl]